MFITRVGLTGKSQQGYKLLKFFRFNLWFQYIQTKDTIENKEYTEILTTDFLYNHATNNSF